MFGTSIGATAQLLEGNILSQEFTIPLLGLEGRWRFLNSIWVQNVQNIMDCGSGLAGYQGEITQFTNFCGRNEMLLMWYRGSGNESSLVWVLHLGLNCQGSLYAMDWYSDTSWRDATSSSHNQKEALEAIQGDDSCNSGGYTLIIHG